MYREIRFVSDVSRLCFYLATLISANSTSHHHNITAKCLKMASSTDNS